MSDRTTIEWTDATWQIVTGCTLVSDGCKHCYAATLAAGRLRHHPSRAGLARRNAAGEAKFTGEVRFNEQWLDQPLRWRKPRRIFVAAHGDLFHEAVPDEWIDQVFAVMALCPQHTFQVLTKRPERARKYLNRLPDRQEGERAWPHNPLERIAFDAFEDMGRDGDVAATRAFEAVQDWPLPNVWLGTSVEDQAAADERIPHLLAAPAAVRFLSAEPLLGPVDLTLRGLPGWDEDWKLDVLTGKEWASPRDDSDPPAGAPRLDWIIVGGESGPGARPMHPDWARSLRDQCAAAGVAFFFKQWGAFHPADQVSTREQIMAKGDMGTALRTGAAIDLRDMWTWRVGKKAAGRLLDGREHNGMPR